MKELEFTININASKEKVWNVLWQDETFKEWANLIDPGTHMEGELTEGREIQFISANGYGVTSVVERLERNKLLHLKHKTDTENNGSKVRDDQWTGGKEIYELSNWEEGTKLTVNFDVPSELEDYFNNNYPKAMECIKRLAEE